MADKKNPSQVNDKAREIIEESRKQSNGKQFILWMAALVVGGALSNAPNPVESREAPPTSSFPGFSEPP